jgi:hypothetical protein
MIPDGAMSDLTMFSKVEADRILKRAAELEGSDEAGPVTIEELRSIAGEVGFSPQAIDRAISEAKQAAAISAERQRVQVTGRVIRHVTAVRSIPVEITADQLMQAVRLFQPYRDGQAHVKLGRAAITWQDRKGLTFRVTSAGGVTEVAVTVTWFVIRRKRWTNWVQTAADRLESLILLMAARDLGVSRTRQLALPDVPTESASESPRAVAAARSAQPGLAGA